MRTPPYWLKFILVLAGVCITPWKAEVKAQTGQDAVEVYLSFEHRNVINSGVIAYYEDDTFYLPLGALFSLLQVDYTLKPDNIVVTGRYLQDQVPYVLSLDSNMPYARMGPDRYDLTTDDFLIRELDYYFHPSVFEKVFDLNFRVDFSNLQIILETDRELPVIQAMIRDLRRQRMTFAKPYRELSYTTRFFRDRKVFGGGFLDYNLSTSQTADKSIYFFNSAIGTELLGGDLQGTVYGSFGEEHTVETNNLRWRTVIQNSPYIKSISMGQSVTNGLLSRPFTGLSISNTPIQPRLLFDEFDISGTTEPRSEIELYLNNTIIDFQEADNQGNYRFLLPLTYGTSRVDLRIYGPTGRIIENSRRIQIPFTFIPEGEFDYTINAGMMDNVMPGEINRVKVVQGKAGFGLTNWLSANVSSEYFEGYHTDTPTLAGSATARIASQYLFTGQYAHEQYYRVFTSAVFPNSAGYNIGYVDYITENGIYNPTSTNKEVNLSGYFPLKVGPLPFSLRASGTRFFRDANDLTRYQFDFNTRINRLNIRGSFRDIQSSKKYFELSSNAQSSLALSYSMSRTPNIPAFIRSTFFRGQLNYAVQLNKIESVDLFLSRDFFRTGQIQLTARKNLINGLQIFGLNLSFSLDKLQLSGSARNVDGNALYTGNIRGSVGYDQPNNRFLLQNRNQVGRSAASVRLFVDDNNSGTWEEGEEVIPNNAIRLNRSGVTSMGKDGRVYITQLRPYEKYNIEINKGAIRNPMLVPQFETFGLETDPNFFKSIEIPFYITGIIDGQVTRFRSDSAASGTGIGGLKLLLRNEGGDYYKEIRTYTEGDYYEYEIPPDNYSIKVDTTQLQILKARSVPETREFEIKPVANGDYVQGLDFDLYPQKIKPEELEEQERTIRTEEAIGRNRIDADAVINSETNLNLGYSISVDSLKAGECRYRVQTGPFSTMNILREEIAELRWNNETAFIMETGNSGYFASMDPASSLTSAAEEVKKYFRSEFSIYQECTREPVPSGVTESRQVYTIQFGALSDRESAEEVRINVSTQTDLNLIIAEIDGYFKVQGGVYNSYREALEASRGINVSSFITKRIISSSGTSVQEPDYLLYLGSFENLRRASLYAIQIDEYHEGLRSKIIIDEKGKITLTLEKEFSTWSEVAAIKSSIGSNPFNRQPVIISRIKDP